ncbi:MAG: DUF1080 domain-containing protein [Isosphaeraceae bacterium]|nr:DUF1080 domain-containing protein [Isosphaeraceae bacterium]
MIDRRSFLLSSLAAAGSLERLAEDRDGFRPLFNGKDLSGWVPVNVAPETFTARDGMIVSTGKPTGVIRTDRHYENFILECEWQHLVPGGNAGLFVHSDPIPHVGVPFTRSIEVQILDGHETRDYTSHGDIFSIWGAEMKPERPHPSGWMRCLPSEKRCKPAPEWNRYRLTSLAGSLSLEVNGKKVSGATECSPRRGYICLEAEGSECRFRNIRIKELPSSGARPDQTARLDEGFVSLYSGLDLRGWKQPAGHEGHWVSRDHLLVYDGKSSAQEKDLWTTESHRDFRLIVDWRLPNAPKPRQRAVVLPNGDEAKNPDGSAKTLSIPYAGDSGVLIRGSEKAQINITCNTVGSGELYGYRTDKKLPDEIRASGIPKTKADKPPGQWNRFEIELRGERLSVTLNGTLVIDAARLPGLPETGPIGLQHHGDPIEFTNLFIAPLD